VDESGGRGFGGEAALLAGARFVTVGALFGVQVLAARALGPEALASAAVGQTIGMIAALVANGGLNIATIYVLQRQKTDHRALVPKLTALLIAACAISIALVLLAAPFVVGLVLPGAGAPLIAAAAVFAAATIAFEVSGAILLGVGRPGDYTRMELLRGVASLAAAAVLLLGPMATDAGFVVGLALGYAVAAALGLVTTRRLGMELAPRYDATFTRTALGFGLRGQVGNVLQFLGVRLDLLIVPALVDLRAAGIYVVAARTADVVGQVATAVSSLVFPRVAGQDDERSTAFTERVTRMTMVAVLVPAVILAVIAGPLLGLLFGEVYAAGADALVVLLVAMLPLSLTRVLAADLKGRGRPGLVSWASLLSAAATVALDLALVPAFGIVGAAFASLLAYVAGAAAILVLYRHVTGARLLALVPTPGDVRGLVTSGAALVRAGRRSA
jgi:O-antigen/teichoic acid export membrane protein